MGSTPRQRSKKKIKRGTIHVGVLYAQMELDLMQK
jgi:hypothetical protein